MIEKTEKVRQTLDIVERVISKYLDMNEKEILKVALWVISYKLCFNHIPSFPFLYIYGTKGSGKSRLMKLLAFLTDGFYTVDPTEAILFRTNKPLFIDEAEQINEKNKRTLREILNVAYKQGGKILRTEKVEKIINGKKHATFEVVEYPVHRLVAIANIVGMEDVLGDRCMEVVMEKSKSVKTKLIENFENDDDCKKAKEMLNELGNLCNLCSLGSFGGYKESVIYYILETWNNIIINNCSINSTNSINYINYTNTTNNTNNTNNTNDIKKELIINIEIIYNDFFKKLMDLDISGRFFELSFPLLLSAYLSGEDIFDYFVHILYDELNKKHKEQLETNIDASLIDFISSLNENVFYRISDLVKLYKDFIEEDASWVNSKWLGRAIKRLNLVINKRRVNGKIEVILNINKAKEYIEKFTLSNGSSATNEKKVDDFVVSNDENDDKFSPMYKALEPLRLFVSYNSEIKQLEIDKDKTFYFFELGDDCFDLIKQLKNKNLIIPVENEEANNQMFF